MTSHHHHHHHQLRLCITLLTLSVGCILLVNGQVGVFFANLANCPAGGNVIDQELRYWFRVMDSKCNESIGVTKENGWGCWEVCADPYIIRMKPKLKNCPVKNRVHPHLIKEGLDHFIPKGYNYCERKNPPMDELLKRAITFAPKVIPLITPMIECVEYNVIPLAEFYLFNRKCMTDCIRKLK